MPIYTHLYLKEQANALLEKFNITEPPVDVRAVAEKLGVEIIEMSNDTWFYGMLTKYGEDFYIVVNKMMPETRKRFAIAHEIGHYQLHDHDLSYQRKQDKDYQHQEADVFALELCIPAGLLKREAHKWFNDHRYLAKLFNVSEPLMVKRMEELNLIAKGKHNWEYAHSSIV